MTGSEIFAQGRIFALIGFSFSRPLAKIKYERERDRDVHMSKETIYLRNAHSFDNCLNDYIINLFGSYILQK